MVRRGDRVNEEQMPQEQQIHSANETPLQYYAVEARKKEIPFYYLSEGEHDIYFDEMEKPKENNEYVFLRAAISNREVKISVKKETHLFRELIRFFAAGYYHLQIARLGNDFHVSRNG
jgi:hypothetical protein